MRIAVALSGGVDSTAVIIKLKSDGHEVFGVTMQVCPDLPGAQSGPRGASLPGGCAYGGASCACQDAAQTARAAGIRLEILDFREAFEREVIAPFVEGFCAGRTPNPCVLCNRLFKFGRLADAARELGAEALATGHYARLNDAGGRPEVRRARELRKDQTYFLSLVEAGRLARAKFPLGETLKDESRKLAAESGWHVRPVTASVEICFLKDLAYTDFLRWRRPEAFQPGEIVDETGRGLGTHSGLPGYTVGQRRGLGVAAAEPLYVVRVEAETNRVVVGPDAALWTRRVVLESCNWLEAPAGNDRPVLAQIRYRQPPVPARLRVRPGRGAVLDFERPVRAVAPGQIGAVYDGERLLGGGVIRGTVSDGGGLPDEAQDSGKII